MPADYDMYFDYKNEYNEDDFFYHMYFDEVSTTPLPDEFYDILHSVSTGVKAPIVAKSPDYESLLANRNIGRHNFTSRLPGAAATTKGGAVAVAPTWVLATQEAAEGEHGDERWGHGGHCSLCHGQRHSVQCGPQYHPVWPEGGNGNGNAATCHAQQQTVKMAAGHLSARTSVPGAKEEKESGQQQEAQQQTQ
jgi:hypothetical protein